MFIQDFLFLMYIYLVNFSSVMGKEDIVLITFHKLLKVLEDCFLANSI